MNLSFAAPITVILFSLLLKQPSQLKPFEYTLQGSVISKENGKPLGDIYLYTIKGEEEAVTNQKGEFKFVTWKSLPLTIYIHYKEAEEIRMVVTNPVELIKIKL